MKKSLFRPPLPLLILIVIFGAPAVALRNALRPD